ncbi:MAG: acyl-CoA dehydrogenase family protein [Pseudomonadales bacterium]|nr:acyl-CoA dehydrogenase family protein [Pseudomonadales bacterium]MBO6565171.1 acyl-CoA dehydrogenase family protein [Pseudomonadales bacterium]MBO6595552.1 acyl-CoA dehydrogenase family protein [Pseudomonadales bacterium]MBO6820890.1 acyl-CoA dehydrogenase family protein [Pseudomonadales bacterium]
MNLGVSDTVAPILKKLRLFIQEVVIPHEAAYAEALESDRWSVPPIMRQLQQRARDEGLFNLFIARDGQTYEQVDYAYLAEQMGYSEIAAEVFNCAMPDSGNMEILARFGNDQQRAEHLLPLLSGDITSGFAMAEPSVASSDATNFVSMAKQTGDQWVLNGEKTWVSGAGDPRFSFILVMCITDEKASPDRQQSVLLVPTAAEGITIKRMLPVFGYDNAPHGYAQIQFENVQVPMENLIGEPGQGFEIAQDRMGTGRIHQCMRSIGAAERALSLMTHRARTRHAFGKPLSELGGNVDLIANSRTEIEMGRLLALRAAWSLQQRGLEKALTDIAQMKVIVPNIALNVIDRAIQMHGGTGVSADTPLARMWASHRALRLSDGPDEVHRELIARTEFGEQSVTYV